jgi:hypothetical protein
MTAQVNAAFVILNVTSLRSGWKRNQIECDDNNRHGQALGETLFYPCHETDPLCTKWTLAFD